MKGSYHVVVQNRYLKYEFDINRNLTLIQGNSATGKTTLVEMIRDFHLDLRSGISISCERSCRVLEGDLWREQINLIRDSILFIDEGSSFVETKEFALAAKNTSNYFVIVTRENLEMLPISVTEVYGIRSSGKYGMLEPVYHEMYHLYDVNREISVPLVPEHLLTEDSYSGYEFFLNVAENNGIVCQSGKGKSNIFSLLTASKIEDELLIIADGAAFASQMNRIMPIVQKNAKIHLYLPESFEWLLLKSELIHDRDLKSILEAPSDRIDSSCYFSWEHFFSDLLTNKTRGTYLQYTKSKLNSNYLQKRIQEKILAHIEGIRFGSQDTE